MSAKLYTPCEHSPERECPVYYLQEVITSPYKMNGVTLQRPHIKLLMGCRETEHGRACASAEILGNRDGWNGCAIVAAVQRVIDPRGLVAPEVIQKQILNMSLMGVVTQDMTERSKPGK